VSVEDQISAALGLRPMRLSPLQGGCIAEVYRADMPDGSRIVAKVASGRGTLDIDGWMLQYLAQRSRLPVPRVLYCEPSLLIMEHIEGQSRFSPGAERHAAELLAELHGIRASSFGLERDTLIGPLPQPNPQSASWIEFFRDHRLLSMAKLAAESGSLPARTHDRIHTLAGRLHKFLYEPEHPSLLHGDVWTTNVLASGDRITGFIDPALYYGHPEIELAFTTLFGTFSPGGPFFERYDQLRPIRPGFFETRRDLYNLYPLLVHVRLFGGGYAAQVESILTQVGC
jgi:fructosamine-3-kinase